MSDELNARQAAFVNHYTSGPTRGNATRSAEAAGYGGTEQALNVTGSRLLSNPKVAAALQGMHEAARTEAIMDLRERKEILTRIARGEITEPKMMGSGDTASVEDVCQTKDRIKAIEVLSKIEGDFVTRVETDGPIRIEWRLPMNPRVPTE